MNSTTDAHNFRRLFEFAPGLYLVLDPQLYVVTATDAYLHATFTLREAIVGRHVFDVFRDNLGDSHADGIKNLGHSLERVKRTKLLDKMALKKYSDHRLENNRADNEARYWSSVNSPVLDANGELKFIIHCVEDVTDIGGGTTVTVEMPAATTPIDIRTTLPNEGTHHQEGTVSIVYVEDTPDNILLVRAILKMRPAIKFITVEEGIPALGVIRRVQPNLVLLDLHLPDINGDEVLRRLQADAETRNIPVVMLSADASKGAADRLIAGGARSYMTKPVGIDELLELVDSHVSHSENAR